MLSTPFWEFQIEELETYWRKVKEVNFLLPFGSFRWGMSHAKMLSGGARSFLLPFGSFALEP